MRKMGLVFILVGLSACSSFQKIEDKVYPDRKPSSTTFTVDGSNIKLRTRITSPLYENPDTAFDYLIEKEGNQCLGKMKKDLQSVAQQTETQALCQRFVAANQELSDVTTDCVLSLHIDRPFRWGRFPLEVTVDLVALGHETEKLIKLSTLDNREVFGPLKNLDWASALEASRCSLDGQKIASSMLQNVLSLETKVQAKVDTNADRAQYITLSKCLNDYSAEQNEASEELRRINTYIPQKFLADTERTSISSSTQLIEAPAPSTLVACQGGLEQMKMVRQGLGKIRSTPRIQ